MKIIVVTGGAGFIGSNTVELLCDLGFHVRVIDDLSFGYRDFVDPRAEFTQASIGDREKVLKILNGADAVIHFAASSIIKFSIENPAFYIQNNILNGTVLLEAMRETGVKKIIFSSSASVYGEPDRVPIQEGDSKRPLQPYGATKLAFEAILSAYYNSYGIESVSLRYFNAYGPRDEQKPATRAVPMWIKEILSGETVKTYWKGSQRRDYVFVKDIAKAHVDVLDLKGCHVFNIGSGEGVLMKDILSEIISLTGKSPTVEDQGERMGDPKILVADISSIKKAVGWQPKFNLHDGLLETVSYYKKRLNL
ncbi:MAG: NAD-dependent epimerase/dehydratase family protein [Candidatus Taylorbacteria bacterium]|nr:NAD-dependent epimerase/dehydratase family protein [Candidatus Taylorbacteria bacterium]